MRNTNNFGPGRGAKYCDQRVCMSVCPSVRLSVRSYPKQHIRTSRYLQYMLRVAVARSSSVNNTIRNEHSVLWMTPCFHITGPIEIQVVGELFTTTRQVAPGAKSALSDCHVGNCRSPSVPTDVAAIASCRCSRRVICL